MYYSYHNKYFPEDVLVYIEEFDKDSRTVLFDFIDSNEYASFANIGDLQSTLFSPSMVFLSNYKLRTIQENTIYAIKRNVIQDWFSQNLIVTNRENSFLIGFTIELQENKENQIFSESVSLNDFDNLSLNYNVNGEGDIDQIPISVEGELSVIIRDVGQGNWNEITGNKAVKIVYDAGAPMVATKKEVRGIIGAKPNEYRLSRPGLILSHWDKDHYHALIGMSDSELSNFSFFVCRNWLPTLTSRILFVRIRNAVGGGKIYALRAETRISRGGPTFFIAKTPLRRQIMLYNAQYHKNRNISGIILSVKTKRSSIILSGDAHYLQISRDVLCDLNYFHNHYLVVPHHGGKAGNYVYNLPAKVIPRSAIISVGRNNYHHPYLYYINALNFTGFKVLQTQIITSDFHVNL